MSAGGWRRAAVTHQSYGGTSGDGARGPFAVALRSLSWEIREMAVLETTTNGGVARVAPDRPPLMASGLGAARIDPQAGPR
jgi:hypothetical protein